jgi:hypothetical protein
VRLGNGVVGRLLDTHEENGEKMIRVHHYSIAPPDDGLLGGNCITNMEERVADNILSWESANSIEDIFFVFRASTIVTKRYSPNGIENAAFVRFFRRVSGALESLAEQTEEPFLDDPYTYSETIFDFLTRVRLGSIDLLSSKRIFVYPNRSVSFEGVGRSCWSYVQRRIAYLLSLCNETHVCGGTSRP